MLWDVLNARLQVMCLLCFVAMCSVFVQCVLFSVVLCHVIQCDVVCSVFWCVVVCYSVTVCLGVL